MKLLDVTWAVPVNILTVGCCGITFRRPSNYSRVRCPVCNTINLWHDVEPRGGVWTDPVMDNCVKGE